MNDDLEFIQNNPSYSKFIHENITSKNYTIEHFLTYIHSLFTSNTIPDIPPKQSLSEWSIDELKITLSDFYLKTPNTLLNKFPCNKLTLTQLASCPNLEITIQNPTTIDKGIFDTSYVIYQIHIPSISTLVNRRYSDFEWLRECLLNIFPGEYIPRLPGKKIGNTRFTEKFIQKRMYYLQTFINEVIQNKNFLCSEPVMVFFTLADRVLFEHQMSTFNPDNISIESIYQLMNTQGEVYALDFDSDNFIYFSNRFNSIYNYLQVHQDVIHKINKELKSFSHNMTKAAEHLDNVNLYLTELVRVNKKAELSKDLERNYDACAHFYRNWSRIIKNQIDVVNSTTRTFCKSFTHQGEVYIELFDKQMNVVNNYNKRKAELLVAKEKLWNEKNIMKWGIDVNDVNVDKVMLMNDKNYAFSKMCYKETNDLYNLYLQLGFLFNCNNEHFFNFKRKFSFELYTSAKVFNDNFGKTITDLLDIWTSMSSVVQIS